MRAQISSQVFIYILAAVVAGIILLVGYKAVATIIQTGGDVNMDRFKTDFETTVAIGTTYGSQKKYEFSLPKSFDEICFVDSRDENNVFSEAVKNTIPGDYPFIQASVLSDANPNIFLLSKGVIKDSFYVDRLGVEDYFLCLENKGKLTVWLKGTGKRAELYE
jgi:hypothetical protein